jgi:alkylhydroperoxidase family enzyme
MSTGTAQEDDMTRISLDPPHSMLYRMGTWYAKRKYGAQMEPLAALGHNRKVLKTNAKAEMSLAKWNSVPDDLKHLAVMSAALTAGCSWCVDFGYWIMTSEGVDPVKIRDVPRWRDSTAYTDLERNVIEYAEAASKTPVEVTDELVAALRKHLSEEQLVELTMMIAVENQRSRFNIALGITSQGFKDRCEIPVG